MTFLHRTKILLVTFGLSITIFSPVITAGEQESSLTDVQEIQGQVGKAPNGFSWKYFKSIKAFFLVPSGWTVQEESQKKTIGILITEKPFDRNGQYKTGFSVNVMHQFVSNPNPKNCRTKS